MGSRTIPHDLLISIANLQTTIDKHQFLNISKEHRAIGSEISSADPRKKPCFLYNELGSNKLCLLESSLHHYTTTLQEEFGIVYGSNYGWIVGTAANTKHPEPFLFYPAKCTKVKLPSLYRIGHTVQLGTLTADPCDPSCTVILFTQSIMGQEIHTLSKASNEWLSFPLNMPLQPIVAVYTTSNMVQFEKPDGQTLNFSFQTEKWTTTLSNGKTSYDSYAKHAILEKVKLPLASRLRTVGVVTPYYQIQKRNYSTTGLSSEAVLNQYQGIWYDPMFFVQPNLEW